MADSTAPDSASTGAGELVPARPDFYLGLVERGIVWAEPGDAFVVPQDA